MSSAEEESSKGEKSLVSLFRKMMASLDGGQRAAAAVVDGEGTKLSFAELDELSDKLAGLFLNTYHCSRGSVVVIFMEKFAPFVVAYVAALKAGCAYLPMDGSYPQHLLESVLEEAKPAVICTNSEFAQQLRQLLIVKNLDESDDNTHSIMFTFDSDWRRTIASETRPPLDQLPLVTSDDLAYIIYSSGTTGKPKGIRCPHRGAVLSYCWRFENYPYSAGERVAANVFFVWEMFRPILKGRPLYIVPSYTIYDPLELCKFFELHSITTTLFTPSLLEAIIDTQPEDVIKRAFKHFRSIWLCGEVVTVALLSRVATLLPAVQLVNLYSISECHDVAACDLTNWLTVAKAAEKKRKFAPVGRVLPSVGIAVLDEQFQKQPVGIPGEVVTYYLLCYSEEIYVGGPTLALGYLNRPELDHTRFVDSPEWLASEFGPRLYRTGDWGYVLAGGELEICGRCDSMVKVRGYSIELAAVEAAVGALAYVGAFAVVAAGEEGDDKQLVAYIVLKEGESRRTRKEIRADLKRRLPFYMIPSFLVLVERLPLVPASSKVDKNALPPFDRSRDTVEADCLPSTDVERRLARLWADVLGRGVDQPIDIQESFFDQGGHSLLASRLLKRVDEEFGVVASVRDLFGRPTISSFAHLISAGASRRVSPAPQLLPLNLVNEVDKYDEKDALIDLNLRAFWRSVGWRGQQNRHCTVLVTGATGFVGAHIVRDLLRRSNVQVLCLVRDQEQQNGEGRLRDAFEKLNLMSKQEEDSDSIREQFRRRVTVIKGDVSLEHFGLSEPDYHFFSYDVDVVIHAAAYVNLVYPYTALLGCNVLGTRNVLLFCHWNKIKALHYVSTDAVIPFDSREYGESDSLEDSWAKLESGYAMTKWVAEQLVIRAQKRGLPAIIYRLGNQGAEHRGPGLWNPQDFFYLLLNGCIAANCAPDIDWRPDVVPVDFTSRFVTTTALSDQFRNDVGKVFHLMATAPASAAETSLDWRGIVQALNDFGYAIDLLPYDQFVRRIELYDISAANSKVRMLERLVDTMIGDQSYFNKLPICRRENTDKTLAQLGQQFPFLEKKLMLTWLKKLSASGQLPQRQLKPRPLDGVVAVVSGASGGIGREIALKLAVDGGAAVLCVGRQTERLRDLVEEIEERRGRALFATCDIVNRDDVGAAISMAETNFGPVHVLVNCAGLMYYTLMEKCCEEQWQRQIDVNCKGTMNCIGAVLKGMVERKKGHILNITSDAGRKAFAGLAVYSGTKFFLEGMATALRQEVSKYGIRVTNVQPGDVATGLAEKSTDTEARRIYDGTVEGDCYALAPADVAELVLLALKLPSNVAINELLVEPASAPI